MARPHHLAWALLVVVGAGCHRHHHPRTSTGYGTDRARADWTYAPTPPTPPGPPASPEASGADHEAPPLGSTTASGTCASACDHYLRCRGVADAQLQASCVARCAQLGLTPQDLLQFERTDCATAIVRAESAMGAGGMGPNTGKDCQGCVWDGSSCIWMSSGTWGSGPYSGAWSTCASACCGR